MMRSPALALTWQVWWRQRWLWAAAAVYVLTLAVVCHALPVGEVASLVGLVGLIPLGWVAILGLGFLALLATGSDLTAKNSGFPSWMFTLPVRTRTLVGWVMLNGTGALLAAWLVVAHFILRPCGIDAPGWLALLAPALLAWIQVLAWTPFAFPLVRLLLMVALLTAIGIMPPLLVSLYEDPSAVIIGLQAALIAVAYVLAGHGVARARRGDGMEARWLPRRVSQFIDRLPRRQRAFASAAGAQLWYEWWRNGTLFPQVVGCLLAFFGPFLLLTEDDWLGYAPALIGSFLALPPILAGLMAAGMGKGDIRTSTMAFPPFLAVRPMATTAFVRVKFRMATFSALAACLLGILAALACLPVQASYEVFKDLWHQGLQLYPSHKAWTLLFLSPFVLFLMTWKNLVEGLWVGLTGRTWVGYVLGLVWTAAWLLLGLVGAGLYYYPQYREYAWVVIPWLAGLALLAKATAAVWVVRALHRRRLLGAQRLAYLVVLWILAVGCLFGLTQWVLPAGLVSLSWLAAGCLFSVPFTQLALAHLALEWNRHR